MRLNPLNEGALSSRQWPDFDPEPTANLVLDFIGSKTVGRPVYKRFNDRYADATQIPGWTYSGSTSNGQPRYAETKAGKLVPFAANVPRITDRGLLVEEARTNLALNSGAPGIGAGWTNNVGYSAAPIDGPDGQAASAVRLTDTNSNSGHRPAQSVTYSATTPYTISALYRAGTRRYVRLTTSGADNVVAVFDTQANAALGTAFAGSPSSISSAITRLGATSWYLISLTFTPSVAHTAIVLVGHAATGVPATAADNYQGVGEYTDFYGFQVEQGAFATSRILTTNAAATRAADSAYITGLSSILGQFRTNYLPNSTWQGGAVGTLPTGMAYSARGLTVAPSGFGVDADGFPYMDLRISGTVTSAGNLDIQNTVASGAPGASVGQVWSTSVVIGQVAGLTPSNGATWSVWEATAGGSWLASSGFGVPTSGPARVSIFRTFSNASAAKAMAALQLASLTVGQVVDVTYRISQPQLETGSTRTNFIPTSTGAVTVGAAFTMAASLDLPANDATIRFGAVASDSTNENRLSLLRMDVLNAGRVSTVAGGAAQADAIAVSNKTGARVLKMAGRVRNAAYSGAVDGVLGGMINAIPPTTMNRIDLGQRPAAAGFPLNGYVQRVAIYGDVDDATLQALAA